MRKRIIFILLILLGINGLAQDPGFSQFYSNPLYLNPALTGTSELPRFVMNYRSQWPQNGATFSTYSVSYDQMSKKMKTGFGIQAFYDKELNNVINTSSASFSYSYNVQLGHESFLNFGLQAGLVLKQFNVEDLVFPSGIDQLSGEIYGTNPMSLSNEKKTYPDFGVGVLGQHNEVFWGASVHHLTQPNESIIEGDQKGKLPMKVTLHSGAMSHRLHYGLLSKEFTLSPNVIYQHQGSFKQLNLGLYMVEKSLVFGAWYRNNLDVRPDALIALVGLAWERFQFGYSFDFTVSKLASYSHGSHEISLKVMLGKKSETTIRDRLLIPMI